ncbi:MULTISPECIES: antibiotic biosynthesis monooxygenase family protein [Streptomyces]|uniref:Antibiotic biosynthesis monooxygenase family protein n=1 Tax=Streptomyces evansiae TaxID=3075535 RepID=A0ABU2QYJ1_9ACTN|nr:MULTISPECIES: antibiotic biosynthesis monooxygenase family protein [unclassified Streptomyces]MDT0408560.1 antibiotic biosynthesis monooxygenase family protein [Streptomyces sp. DSM 41979]MYQ58704.1 antibiotic biosynthesis monooxygenase [Streptomyces sp. SID4926]SCD60334.1 Quinol monooxygenase YgiN [Streptomyces sp. DfronAA-171]
MVTMINQMLLHGDESRFLAVLEEICAHMRAQPGFLSLRLHRSPDHPERWAMLADWSDADAHRAAASAPGIRPAFARLRAEAHTAPQVYAPVPTPGAPAEDPLA